MMPQPGHGWTVSLGAMICAGLVAVLTIWRAVVIDSVAATRSRDDTLSPVLVSPRHAIPIAGIANTVEKDPFRPDRRPGERLPASARTRTAPVPRLRLAGTMMYPGGGGAALLEGADRSTRIVRVGEKVGELTLRSVTSGEAVFVSPTGATVTVRVQKPGG